MDRKVLIYSATEHFDDMPVGDKDDDEESRSEMKQVAGTFLLGQSTPNLLPVFWDRFVNPIIEVSLFIARIPY